MLDGYLARCKPREWQIDRNELSPLTSWKEIRCRRMEGGRDDRQCVYSGILILGFFFFREILGLCNYRTLSGLSIVQLLKN